MQPFFFPYIGSFQMLAAVDHWFVLDAVQFVHKGWVNRNRLLHPNPVKKWQFFTVPVKSLSRNSQICDLEIDASRGWVDTILGKYSCYANRAPQYEDVRSFVDATIKSPVSSLSSLVVDCFTAVRDLLGIATPISVVPHEIVDRIQVEHPGQWAWKIAKEMGADSYVNPIGGAWLFRPEEFAAADVGLELFRPSLPEYSQAGRIFEPALSVIDVLSWNNLAQCREMVHEGQLIPSSRVFRS